jgi:predicted ATP-dependent protease
MEQARSLSSEELCWRCDPDQFDFETTQELEGLPQIIGQPRAIEAMQFGVNIEQKGYNIFAFGLPGTGKRTLVQRLFQEKAANEPTPEDWCYVNNFEQPHKPRALNLPPGQGLKLQQDMAELVEELQTVLPAAFESEEFQARLHEVEEEFRERQEQAFEEIRRQALTRDLTLIRTPAGIVFAPVRDGAVLSPEELQKMTEEQRKELETKAAELQEELQRGLRQVPRWQREMRERLKELNREFANFAVSGLMNELREKYTGLSEVIEYLNEVQNDIIQNAKDFLPSEDGQLALLQQSVSAVQASTSPKQTTSPFLRRYQVNVLVNHSDSEGAPVIFEDNPSYQNLIGRVEYMAQMGALMTDFNLIKPGSLHQANGGYLILEARKLLLHPFAWEGLKRALQSNKLQLESPSQMYGMISTASPEPEPIPLDVKVALLGDPFLYYLLAEQDPDFSQLFKVAADFDDRMNRDPDTQELYARMIADLVRQDKLRPFDRAAVARVIEHSARVVSDAERLTAQIRTVANLLREADYWAGQAGKEVVAREDVQRAIDAQVYRSDRIRERMQEQILRETVLIDTEGARIGQINGLSVIQLSGFAFGRPTRITARVRLGEGQVIDIEREVDLGGAIHSKGVLILSGFVGARYAKDRPLSLSASLVFEQSYGGVEGDSASSAELYALLSAIAEIPIRQSLAVTGSVNQHGQVQAIGGANEKI